MHTAYETLPTIVLQPNATLLHPHEPPRVVHLDDPARWIIIDFSREAPTLIKSDATLAEAEMQLATTQSRLLFVIDQNNLLLGLVSKEDLMGDKPIRISQVRQIRRGDIPVNLLMIPREHILVLSMTELKNAKVGHINTTLRSKHQHYALAVLVNEETQQQTICGAFSLLQISKQLGTVTREELHARSLLDILKTG